MTKRMVVFHCPTCRDPYEPSLPRSTDPVFPGVIFEPRCYTCHQLMIEVPLP